MSDRSAGSANDSQESLADRRVAIIGAGLMGHGLAQVFALAGAEVTVHDPVREVLRTVRDRVKANLIQLGQRAAAAERISAATELAAAVRDAELVIEATPEDLGLKRSVFAALEREAPRGAILATNTSVIPVSAIAEGLTTRDRVLGTHWWNPPYLIPLVEVVQTADTDPDVVQRTSHLLAAAGKEPVQVLRDVPGFIGNRLQHALWREAVALVAEGICDAETVDTVVKSGFGARLAVLGPLENADLIGLDLTLAIHEQVLPHIDRTPGPVPYLRELVAQGRLGMKTGEGFRRWDPDARERTSLRLLRHLQQAAPAAESAGTNPEGGSLI